MGTMAQENAMSAIVKNSVVVVLGIIAVLALAAHVVFDKDTLMVVLTIIGGLINALNLNNKQERDSK